VGRPHRAPRLLKPRRQQPARLPLDWPGPVGDAVYSEGENRRTVSPSGGARLERATYAEAELVENRVPVLLFGGTAAERQAWAEETAARHGCALTLVTVAEALAAALAQKDGVVYVADALSLGDGGQHQLVVCLQTQEERPKLVVAVARGGDAGLAAGGLRPDLHYRLRLSQVNLDAPGLRESIAKRRARRPASPSSASRPGASRSAPSRRRSPVKTQAKRPAPRRAAPKRSRR
jgi:hypothetical protein